MKPNPEHSTDIMIAEKVFTFIHSSDLVTNSGSRPLELVVPMPDIPTLNKHAKSQSHGLVPDLQQYLIEVRLQSHTFVYREPLYSACLPIASMILLLKLLYRGVTWLWGFCSRALSFASRGRFVLRIRHVEGTDLEEVCRQQKWADPLS